MVLKVEEKNQMLFGNFRSIWTMWVKQKEIYEP